MLDKKKSKPIRVGIPLSYVFGAETEILKDPRGFSWGVVEEVVVGGGASYFCCYFLLSILLKRLDTK